MRSSKRKYMVLASISMFAACSTPKPGTPEFVRNQEQEQQKTAVKNVETAISKTPSWYVQPPQDANAIYTQVQKHRLTCKWQWIWQCCQLNEH